MVTFRNPVIPGFHPDPSLCRVDEDYYLATSTFAWWPGIQLFHSRDLVHWRPLGGACTRPSQLNLRGRRPAGGIFAPTLRHHDGRFWLICTDQSGQGNFVLTAADAAGPWSDPVLLPEVVGIDPSLTWDEDGTALVAWTRDGQEILGAPADLTTGKLLAPPRLLWQGTGNKCPEAPHLYRIGTTWYQVLAEGGTEYGHLVSIARGPSPWGPWEACPHNPVLSHRRHWRAKVQATGHGDLLQAHDGSWWMAFLGIRPVGGMFHCLGRETFLTPVTWQDGWPVIASPLPEELPAPSWGLRPWPAEPLRDDFDAPALGPRWNHLREVLPHAWSLTERPGHLRLRGQADRLDTVHGSPLLIARPLEAHVQTMAVHLEVEDLSEGGEAGVTLLMDHRHHDEIYVTLSAGRRVVRVRRRIGDLQVVVGEVTAPAEACTLAIAVAAPTTAFQLNGQTIATGETRYLSTEVTGGFSGLMTGPYACGPATVAVDWAELAPRA